MKKYIYIIAIISLLITFFTCTVNENTGLIKVENYTYLDLKNVKIGDTSIAWIVAGGAYTNYWYYKTITGQLTTEGIPVHPQFEDVSFTLEPGYYVYIIAKYMEDGSEYVVIDAEEHGAEDTVDLTD